MNETKVDKLIFWPSLLCILAVSLLLAFFPSEGEIYLKKLFNGLTQKTGWFFLIFIFMCMMFLIWLAFSKYGKIKLGDCDPQFSTISWVSMLFCASIGSSILYWGSIEWIYYYVSPPFGVEPYSSAAAEWASTYGLFHWGVSAWSIYCLVAIPVSYYYYIKKVPVLRLSSACKGVIGKKQVNSITGKLIDIFVIIGMIGGVSTSIALGTPMVAEGISELFGVKPSFTLDIVIILIWGSIFGASVYLGIEKGIKRLSNINIIIAIVFLVFALVTGPTSFILNSVVHSAGKMFQNFIQMSFYTDPIIKSGFPQNWTVFYWAWWIVYTPSVGLFIAKISKGRTIKQVILGSTIFGSLGCWIFFGILGNYSLSLQLNNTKDVVSILLNNGGPTAIMAILDTFPFNKSIIALFVILAFISLATTLDSAAYTMASIATSNLENGKEPARWHRLIWAFAITLLPIVLIFVGGLESLKITSIIGSLPLIVILIIIIISFMKTLINDFD